MNKLKFKIGMWLLHSAGFQVVAAKQEDGNIWVEGDMKAMRYFDIDKYFKS